MKTVIVIIIWMQLNTLKYYNISVHANIYIILNYKSGVRMEEFHAGKSGSTLSKMVKGISKWKTEEK